MRNIFIDELVKLGRLYPHIALIVGDLGYSVVEPFADEFPERFINAGVAEQNMTGLAAGMASEGYHVFTYSIANFPTFRCAEQIRNDVAHHNLPVTVVSVGGGLSYGALGYSHHAVQDYALMRSFPNMLIAAPGDSIEVRSCLRYLVAHPGPSYLRLGKLNKENFHTKFPDIKPGCWVPVYQGGDSKVILTTGATLGIAMKLVATNDYKNFSVYSMPLWSMKVKEKQLNEIRSYSQIITIEDHLLDGGFGSWLLESKSMDSGLECIVTPVCLDAIVCETVGSQETLEIIGGLYKLFPRT